MSVAAALREAQATEDGPTWVRASRLLLRAGELERAAVAARRALRFGAVAMDILDATTPAGDELTLRMIDVSRQYGTAGEPLDLGTEPGPAWAQSGGRLLVPGGLPGGMRGPRPVLAILDIGARSHRVVSRGVNGVLAASLDEPVALVRLANRQLASCDLTSGRVSRLLPCPRGEVRSSCIGRSHLALAEFSRLRAFELPRVGEPRLLIDHRCAGPHVDGSGAFVHVDLNRRLLSLHDFASPEPRACAVIQFERDAWVRAAGRRAVVVVGMTAELIDEDGRTLQRAELPVDAQLGPALPNPSGWLLACRHRQDDSQLGVVDLRSGVTRWFSVGAPITGAAWSPSGRRLAITLFSDTLRVALVTPA
jgi:hypothetical protein